MKSANIVACRILVWVVAIHDHIVEFISAIDLMWINLREWVSEKPVAEMGG